jgi:hypothetical protein
MDIDCHGPRLMPNKFLTHLISRYQLPLRKFIFYVLLHSVRTLIADQYEKAQKQKLKNITGTSFNTTGKYIL